ncbi:MAG: sulfatase [Clostridiales bacterium]|nr:sulfatase [Clostridiales bacterium]
MFFNYFKRFYAEVLYFLPVAFCLGFVEGLMIASDRLVGLGGWYLIGINLGLIYLVAFGLPVLLAACFFSKQTRNQIFWSFSAFMCVLMAARIYRIFYGKLIDLPVKIFGLLALTALVGGAFIKTRKKWWLVFTPFLLVALYFAGSIYLASPRPTLRVKKPQARPNIVWITADALRSDHLKQYGGKETVFSAFDRWQEDFIKFSNSYSTCSWTAPSVASMLTSLYPLQHGKSKGSLMNHNIVTLPQVLKKLNYSTYAVSNQPLVSPGWGFGKGFDFFYATSTVFMESTLVDILNEFWLEENMVSYLGKLDFLYRRFKPTHQSPRGLLNTYNTIMKQKLKNPFFLYLYFFDPHAPYNPEEKWYPAGTEDLKTTEYFNQKEDKKPEGVPSETVLKEIKRRYDGEINDVADKIDKILADLKQRGLYRESIIIFTSDHGEKFYDHGGWLHGGKLYQEVTRVPLFIKLPGNKLGNEVAKEPVDNVDIFPTILNVLNTEIQLDYSISGESLLKNGQIKEDFSPPVSERISAGSPGFHVSLVQNEKKVFFHNQPDTPEYEAYQLLGPQNMSWKELDKVPERSAEKLNEISINHQKFEYSPESIGFSQRQKLKALGYIE